MENNTTSSFLYMMHDYLPLNETFDTPFTFASTRIMFIVMYVIVFIICIIGESLFICCLLRKACRYSHIELYIYNLSASPYNMF